VGPLFPLLGDEPGEEPLIALLCDEPRGVLIPLLDDEPVVISCPLFPCWVMSREGGPYSPAD